MSGIVGSVISWLLKLAYQEVKVLPNNIVVLVIAFIRLLFALIIKQVRRGESSAIAAR